jgi:hypothetical protein
MINFEISPEELKLLKEANRKTEASKVIPTPKTYHCMVCALETHNQNKAIHHTIKHNHLVLHVEKGWFL